MNRVTNKLYDDLNNNSPRMDDDELDAAEEEH